MLQLEKLNIEWQDMQIIQKLKRDCLHLGKVYIYFLSVHVILTLKCN